MKERLSQELIAARAAKEFADGDYVNLGYGIPNLCTMYLLPGKEVYLHSEQGLLGYGSLVTEDAWQTINPYYVDSGSRFVHSKPGMCSFDMDLSFDMIRGGHIDIAVLGAFQVSEEGDLANWSTRINTESKTVLERGLIGGGMDLAVGSRRVIVCMEHTTKEGDARIVKRCKYPVTALKCVDLIVTDIAVIEVGKGGLILKEYAPGWTPEEIQTLTEPNLVVAKDLQEIQL